ncbi:MAG TPA: hypothetical protein VGY66_22130 [Gemmataceae bacterium]|jgi:hypothetical protein|nr:hypothetical protein [Gemmataceae bacterium]
MAKSRRDQIRDRAGDACWSDHFAWRGPILIGKTAIARATIDVLRINDADRVEQRRMLMEIGEFPAE